MNRFVEAPLRTLRAPLRCLLCIFVVDVFFTLSYAVVNLL